MAIPTRARGETAAPLVLPQPTLPALREAAAGCRACELWRRGAQTVFGEGPERARVMMVDVERNLIAVSGSVPGAKGGIVVIKEARKGGK